MTAISRVFRDKSSAEKFYSNFSRWYDAFSGNFEKKYRDIGIELMDPKQGESILEIGFGTGESIVTIAQYMGGNDIITGIDISRGMHTITKKRLMEHQLTNNVDLHLGDATKLPFEPEKFHAIFISFTLELFDTPDIDKVLKECYRVLKPDGRIIVVALSRMRQTAMVKMYEYLHNRFPIYLDCRPIYSAWAMRKSQFKITKKELLSMWGLPVEIIRGRKIANNP